MALTNFSRDPKDAGAPPNMPLPFNLSQDMMTNDVSDMLINYNEKFANADPALFRDEVTSQLMSVLIGKTKPCALLVGPAGCGKTHIVEDLARRIEQKDGMIPVALKESKIYELPLSLLTAGTGIVGVLEEKLNAVIDFITDKDEDAILFIDEIHLLANDSNNAYGKIAQILKPAMARGDMRIIGSTTLQESQKFMNDPALNRRFSRIIVDELGQEETVEILKAVAPNYIRHYNTPIVINDDVYPQIVQIADRYASAGGHRPDTALTLFDRAIADAIMTRNRALEDAKSDPNLYAALKANPQIPLTEKQLRKTAIRQATGSAQRDEINIDSLRASCSHILGQDKPLEEIFDLIKRYSLDLFPRTTPLTILLTGSSGVGKTEIAKMIAKEMSGTKPIVVNMTEYHSSASINRLIGSPTGYIGSDSNAELPFDILESNPYQVILLDEFEKGDKSVQRLFMSAFDEGYIKTARNKIVDFSKSIIIVTTNAYRNDNKRNSIGFATSEEETKLSEVVDDMQQYFDPELLNRFDAIVTFNPLSKDVYKHILISKYASEVARIKSYKRLPALPDELDEDAAVRLTKESYIAAFGARPAEKTIQKYIESLVAS